MWGGDGGGGGPSGYGDGGRGRLCTYRYAAVTTRMIPALTEVGSDESHFNVSVGCDGKSHRPVSTNHNLFEEKGREPKPEIRTEVLRLLTSLTP